MRSKFGLLTVVLLVVLFTVLNSILVLGIEDTKVACTTNQDCYDSTETEFDCVAPGDPCACKPETKTCWINLDVTTSTQATATSVTTPAAAVALAINQTALDDLKKSITALQTQSLGVDERVKKLEDNLVLVQEQLTEFGTSIETLNSLISEQSKAKETLQKDVSSVATGLAGLQETVGETQEDVDTVEKDLEKVQRFRKVVIIIAVILIAAGTVLAILYFTSPKQKIDSRVTQYIISQAKQGKRFPHIQEALRKAGWADEDIKRAYQEAMKAGTRQAAGRAAGGMDQKRIVLIAGFTVFLIIGVILVIKGVTTGKAIHFLTTGELNKAVKDSLEKNMKTNPFYEKVKMVDLCVQVEDEDKVVSYRVQKTKKGDFIKEAKVNCDNTADSGFAVKFKSWESFDLVSNSLTCSNIKSIHGRKLMYVLPSKNILPGFELEPTTDLTSYCGVLKLCLSDQELKKAEIDC